MSTHVIPSIQRRQEALARFCLSNSSFHNQIRSGLIPPPIALGDRAVAWVSSEIDAVIAARIAGKSKQEIKDIVSCLVSSRTDVLAA